MVGLSPAVGVVVILALVVVSAFFSSSETAIFAAVDEPGDDADAPGDDGDAPGDDEATDSPDGATAESETRAAATLQRLKADPHRLLVTLLVGNNVVNVAIASLSTAILLEFAPPGAAVTLATVAASVLVLIFGEIVPKSYGLANARAWSLTVAGPIALVERALYPVVVVFDLVTRQLNALLGGDHAIERHLTDD